MAQEITIKPQTLEISDDPDASASPSQKPPVSATAASFPKLNPNAREFVPRSAAPPHAPPPETSEKNRPLESNQGAVKQPVDSNQREPEPSTDSNQGVLLSDEVVKKIIEKVEYYFSDINLVTTEQLMKFISKDPEGYAPISVVASFKEIKDLVPDHALLAYALRKSSVLSVNDTGTKVKRNCSINDSYVKELQSRIVVAENLPENHRYQNLMKLFSDVGRYSVKAIRTCYPRDLKAPSAGTNKSGKPFIDLKSKLHAFVEYKTVEGAKNAVAELNDEKLENGLRVRLFHSDESKQEPERGSEGGHEGDVNKEEDVSTPNESNVGQMEDPAPPSEA